MIMMKSLKEEFKMKKETEMKIEALNNKINAIKETISKCYDNSERARLDSEIKKCRKEIDELNRSELEPTKVVAKIDSPTILESNHTKAITNRSGSISKLGGGNFSVSL